MTVSETFLVASIHPWNRRIFEEQIANLPGSWAHVDSPEKLLEKAKALRPQTIFFPHWSWRVPVEILAAHECIGFHMTPLPYGRGGSPLQNLIERGHRETQLCAIRLVREIDAGPVYLRERLSLEGSAEEIYVRAGELAARMIGRILREKPAPVPQQGEPTVFRRRTPAQSEMDSPATLEALYDFIRMLDAEGYPRAFFDRKGFRYEFSRVRREGESLRAEVRIAKKGEGQE